MNWVGTKIDLNFTELKWILTEQNQIELNIAELTGNENMKHLLFLL